MKLLLVGLHDTILSVDESSTISYVFTRNGAGTPIPEPDPEPEPPSMSFFLSFLSFFLSFFLVRAERDRVSLCFFFLKLGAAIGLLCCDSDPKQSNTDNTSDPVDYASLSLYLTRWLRLAPSRW